MSRKNINLGFLAIIIKSNSCKSDKLSKSTLTKTEHRVFCVKSKETLDLQLAVMESKLLKLHVKLTLAVLSVSAVLTEPIC